MTRVLVSGGTGYVGRFIVEHLLANGYKVTVGARTPPPPGFFSKPVGFTRLVLDPDRDQIDAFDDVYYFVHAAFDHVEGKYRGGEGNDPAGFARHNLDGSATLFENARDAGVRRCCFVSSRAVYGNLTPGTRLVETMPARPDTLYGLVKLQAERSLSALCNHAFITTSLRVTGVYGPAGIGRSDKWQQPIMDYIAGKQVGSRAGTEVHGQDVGAAVRLMLESDGLRINGEVFNVSDLAVDMRDVLSIVRTETGLRYPLPDPADGAALNVMDTTRLERLGWRPGGPDLFEKTVRQLVGN